MAYPDYYGEEVLQLLEELKVIEYQPWKKSWSFQDREHIIPYRRRQQCFENGKIRNEVIPEGREKSQFLEIISHFSGKMSLPTRLIEEEYHFLNDITFLDFLNEKMEVSSALKRQLDYHMLDDWGGKSDQVSALAGIHYFMCRPYYTELVELFSPPNGNEYFIEKMRNQIASDRIHLNHLVTSIEKEGSNFLINVLDIENKKSRIWEAENVIYAGQKHAMKYIFPEEYRLFENQEYAPWMVINFIADQRVDDFGFWQNEYLGDEIEFLGFIDSSVQDQGRLKGKRIYTAYYCFEPKDREYLSTISENSNKIVRTTQARIEEFLRKNINVQSAFVNVMGHAMPIPKPGYLFRDNEFSESAIKYAGVDAGRLPLLFEAMDSGIQSSS